MRIIPAIDIIKGKCVRLTKGDYTTQIIYNKDPLEVAKEFEDHGIKYLHLVDLEGAKSDSIVNANVLEQLATKTNLRIDFGGGIKSKESINLAFELGANQVTVGSIAVKEPQLVEDSIRKFGAEKIILGADVVAGKIAINGWKKTTKHSLTEFIKSYMKKGIRSVISTDISKDGMMEGSSLELYQQLISLFPTIKLIASGGISSLKELDTLKSMKIEGAIIGKALYENKISLKELQTYVN